jgi:hypothetical protein
MSCKKDQRKHLFVDPKVQGALATRVVLYWVMCVLSVGLWLLCWRMFIGPEELFTGYFDDLWFFFGPALIASLLLLPLAIFDVIQFSNRFVGPLLRLRRSMRALARGEYVEPLQFRQDDFWQEFAAEFNAVRAKVLDSNPAAKIAQEAAAEEEPAIVGS